LANRLHILAAMGVELNSAAEVDAMLQARELADATSILPHVYLCAPGEVRVRLSIPVMQLDEPVDWRLQHEDLTVHEGRCLPSTLNQALTQIVGGNVFDKRELPLPALPLGYHVLTVHQGNVGASTLLIVAPAHTYQPQALQEGRRLWGISVQLYTVKSADDWGMGDFADLLYLVEQAAAQGASFVLLNPLHYLDLRYPENASPYSPSDRRLLNPLYIAAELSEDFLAPAVQACLAQPEIQQKIQRLRASADVDYAGVTGLKLPLLALMFRHFCQFELELNTERADQFMAFAKEGGASLRTFAEQQARLRIRAEPEFAEPEFHLYLQWLCHQQLDACQQMALRCGMELGLVRDLAVGSSSDGSEVLNNPGLFCEQARVGAPPDNFNPHGQNWGLPPLLPQALLATRFAHYIDLLRSNMRSCGALRIDHVMSLMRLWWCPNDGSNANGAYVYYPVDVMFALLRLESWRHRCVVIGEDLGVVPPEICGYLDPAGIYSNCVFYFEKYDGWHFRKPEHYKVQALAMIANHDVPPLIAWWNGSDLLLRQQIGLITDDEMMRYHQDRRIGEKSQILQWLAEQDLLPEEWLERDLLRPLDRTLTDAILRACGRTASKMLSVQLDDLAGADTPVNIPGTSVEYPNWRRKLPVTLTDLFADATALRLLRTLGEERPK
jgi:4-alpha-glucanotransferase